VVTKAALPGGIQLPSGAQTSSLAPQIAALQQGTGQGQAGAITMAEPLPRSMSDFIAAFGPGVPLVPAPLNGVRPDTGQQDPRRYAYPVSWNLSRDMQRHTPWSLLIQAADKVDVIRRCIEVRKNEQVQQDWDFTLSKRALEAAGANTPAEKSALREKYSDKIRQLVDWWQTPDRTNGLEFETWLSMALEEHFVLDALSIYPRLTYGGDLASLEVLDGSTIKPLLDARGNRPAAPAPAFQQWLYGFPRGEYTDLGPSDSWEGDAGSLIYAVKTARTRSPYGLSVVEQALVSADLWMHRQQWMRSEYTEGTLPTSWLTVDQAASGMTPEQIRSWETSLNDFYGGGVSERHRMRLLPGGVKPVDTQDVSERYKPDYDEFLVKLVISHFDVDPMEIGFAPKGGLGGSGFSDGQQDTKYRQAIKPTNSFLSNIINQISRRYLDMPPELTHQFLGMEQDDEAAADTVAESRTSSGRMTFNEDRDRMGMPRYEGEWADKPFIVTGTGPVWLDDAYEEAQKPPEPVPAGLAPHAGVPPGQVPAPANQRAKGQKPDEGPGNIPAKDEDDEEDEDPEADAVAEKAVGELVAFGRFLAKRGKATRPFAFEHLDKAAGALLNETAASDPEWAAELAGDIVKVGPKGYKHGWIYVGGPGLPKHRPGAKKPDTGGSSGVHALEAGETTRRGPRLPPKPQTPTAEDMKHVRAAKLTNGGQETYASWRRAGKSHDVALAEAKDADKEIRAAQVKLREDTPAARAKRPSTFQDDKGRKVTITAEEKKAVKAAKLHPTQQMTYTQQRFEGKSHDEALAYAAKTTPAKKKPKSEAGWREQEDLRTEKLTPIEQGTYAANRAQGMQHDEALASAVGRTSSPSRTPVTGGTLDQRDEVRQAMNDVTKDFPDDVVSPVPVRVASTKGGTGNAKNAIGLYSSSSTGKEILVDQAHHFGDPQGAHRSIARASQIGWYTPSGIDDPLKHTLTHEFGHHLDFSLHREDREKLFSEIGPEIGFAPRKPGEELENWVARNKDKIVLNVGTYAATNDRELMAELWTEYAGKGKAARPAARILGEYVMGKLAK
jgi:hypothetical protein